MRQRSCIFIGPTRASGIRGFDPLQGLPSREDMWRRIHPDDQDRVGETVQEALRQKTDFATKYEKILLPDGTVKYLEGTSHHLFSSEGALLEAITSTVDVTQRKRTEQALRASEAKFRAAIDGIAELVAIMAPSGELESVQQPAHRVFRPGCRRAEGLGDKRCSTS